MFEFNYLMNKFPYNNKPAVKSWLPHTANIKKLYVYQDYLLIRL